MKLTRLFAIVLALALPVSALHAQEIASPEVHETVTEEVGAPAPAVQGEPDVDAAAHAEEGHGKGGLPQMDVSTFPSQLFWLAVNFGLMFLLMWRVALPMVTRTFHKRACALHDALTAAHAAREKAQSLREHSGILTSTANDDVKKFMDKLNAEILAEQQKRDKELSALISARQADAEKALNDLTTEVEHQIPEQAAAIASAVIEKLTPLKPSPEQIRQAAHSLPAPVLQSAGTV